MSFVSRELNRIQAILSATPKPERYTELYAAQQALAWALEPTGFQSPVSFVLDTREDEAGCSPDIYPVRFLGSPDHCAEQQQPKRSYR